MISTNQPLPINLYVPVATAPPCCACWRGRGRHGGRRDKVLAGVAADAAAGVKNVLAAEVDDGGGGLHDVSTVALRLHTNGHSGLVSMLRGFSSMIFRSV